MKIGYIQNAPVFGDKQKNFDGIAQLAKGITAELLVLPELFATGYTFTSKKEAASLAETTTGETAKFLQQLSAETGAVIVAGFVEEAEGTVYNSSIIVYKDEVIDTYRKLHLFNRETLWFSPGNKPFKVHDVNGYKIGVMICFDWIFPESVRTLALLGAEVIAHPSNLVLPYCQTAMVTRCLENRVFAVTANRVGSEVRGTDDFTFTGSSQITATNGAILSSAPINQSFASVVEIDPSQAHHKMINPYNSVIADRRPEFYL
jgi:predicted amidohydrolase